MDHSRGTATSTSTPGWEIALVTPQPAAALAVELAKRSAELREVWARQEVGLAPRDVMRYRHPEVGLLELHCQRLLDPEQSHAMLVYTAAPGSPSYERLQLLSAVGTAT